MYDPNYEYKMAFIWHEYSSNNSLAQLYDPEHQLEMLL